MATFQAYQPINMDTLSVLSGDFTDWSGSMLEYTAGSTVMTYFGAFTITDTGLRVVLDQSDGTGAYGTLNGYTAEVSGVLGYAVDGVALDLLDFFSATTFLDSHAMLASGNDSFTGSSGDDLLYGMNGRDTMRGSLGDDVLYGGKGRDTLQGGSDDDTLRGEGATISSRAAAATTPSTAAPATTTCSATRVTIASLAATGSTASSVRTAMNVSTGGEQSDLLNGGGGNDRLYGGKGDDNIFGAEGRDVVYGGSGADEFAFMAGSEKDIVKDFEDDGDTLVFDPDLWGGTAKTATEVLDEYGEIVNGNAIFDFGGGDVMKVTGVSELSLLYNDVWTWA